MKTHGLHARSLELFDQGRRARKWRRSWPTIGNWFGKPGAPSFDAV